MSAWTQSQIDLLIKHYSNTSKADLVKLIGRKESSIYNKAYSLNLKKTSEYLASPEACRLRRGDNVGAAFRFQKGHQPANKGVKGINHEGSKLTQFKKGQAPKNKQPVGYIRKSKDGYLEIKVAEGMGQFRLLHRIVYERMNGKIPEGMIVIFLDNNKENLKISNLSLITKGENMKRNSYHNYPKEIAQLIQLRGAINRQINRRAA